METATLNISLISTIPCLPLLAPALCRFSLIFTTALHSLFIYSEKPLPCPLLHIGSGYFFSQNFSCINNPTISYWLFMNGYGVAGVGSEDQRDERELVIGLSG
jgi:hypothetical protein